MVKYVLTKHNNFDGEMYVLKYDSFEEAKAFLTADFNAYEKSAEWLEDSWIEFGDNWGNACVCEYPSGNKRFWNLFEV